MPCACAGCARLELPGGRLQAGKRAPQRQAAAPLRQQALRGGGRAAPVRALRGVGAGALGGVLARPTDARRLHRQQRAGQPRVVREGGVQQQLQRARQERAALLARLHARGRVRAVGAAHAGV